jgi:hypothetical protein
MTAIVKADDYVGGLPEVFQLAKSLKLAGGFLPSHLKNEGEIVAVVLAGRELGLPPMASIRGIKLVKGNVTLDASLQLALMVRAGCKVKWLKDGSDGEAILRLERAGQEPHESRFTLADAKRAGLTGDNWSKYPAAMLRARCVTTAGKAYVPDVLAGVYLPDELPTDEPTPVRPVRSLDDVAKEGEQRPSPTDAGVTERGETPSDTPAKTGTTSEPAHTKTGTTEGELLDAAAWRVRYEAVVDEAIAQGLIVESEDEHALPVPPLDVPSFSAKAKRHAGKAYDEVEPGFLREVIASSAKFTEQSLQVRLWTLYLVARHEAAKEMAA